MVLELLKCINTHDKAVYFKSIFKRSEDFNDINIDNLFFNDEIKGQLKALRRKLRIKHIL
jgi:hypothetical protein